MKEHAASPRVTVLMAAYNGEAHIRDAIKSVLAQTFGDFRLLIIDDASSDRTGEIVGEFNDPRITCVRNEHNLGLAASLNRGLDLIDTQFVVRMDCDDTCHPRRIEWQVAFMEAHPNCGMSGTWLKTFGLWGQRGAIRYPETYEEIKVAQLFSSPVAHATLIMRKELFKKHSIRYNPEYSCTEDFDLCVRATKSFEVLNLPAFLYLYRRHSGCVTVRAAAAMRSQVQDIIRRQLIDLKINPTEKQLDLHSRPCLGAGAQGKEDLFKGRDWFFDLRARLVETGVFSDTAVNHIVGRQWFLFCRHSAGIGSEAESFWRKNTMGYKAGSSQRIAFRMAAIWHGLQSFSGRGSSACW